MLITRAMPAHLDRRVPNGRQPPFLRKGERVGAGLCLSKRLLHGKVAFVTVSNDDARVRVTCPTHLGSVLELRAFDGLNRPTLRFTGPARRPWKHRCVSAARAPVQPLVRWLAGNRCSEFA